MLMSVEPQPQPPSPASASAEKTPDEAAAPSSGAQIPVNKLTPEEQMALFEKELKEKDWGHQPC